MNRYAATTDVPVERSKRAIEQLLMHHGADQYHTGWDSTRDIIEFGWKGKQIRFILPRVKNDDYALTSSGLPRNRASIVRAVEQADRQRWRALYLVVRAKLESVDAGISIFEEEFLAFIVVPGQNKTVGEILVPRIEAGVYDVNRQLEPGRTVQ